MKPEAPDGVVPLTSIREWATLTGVDVWWLFERVRATDIAHERSVRERRASHGRAA